MVEFVFFALLKNLSFKMASGYFTLTPSIFSENYDDLIKLIFIVLLSTYLIDTLYF